MRLKYRGESYARLTNGREYVVMATLFSPKQGNDVFVVDDLGGRTWFPAAQFESVSDRIPPWWIARIIGEVGTVALMPWRFLVPGFWDDWNSGSGPRRAAATKVIREEIEAAHAFDAQVDETVPPGGS